MQIGTDSGEELAEMLRKGMAAKGIGDDPLREIDSHYERLSQFEKTVLLQLHNWSQDAALRNSNEVYAAYNTRRLTSLLETMNESA